MSQNFTVRSFAPSWRQSLLGSAASLAFIGLSVPAFAQYASPAPSTGTSPAPAQGNAPVQLPSVSVEGQTAAPTNDYKIDQSNLTKFTEPLQDTPQTVDTVSRQLMNDQGNTNLRDALRNVPGISLAAGEFGAQGDNFTIRGFTARNDIFIDGIRDFGSYYRDPFYLESIEVLKGPASTVFGRGSTGGVVEQDSKQPVTYPITAGTASVDTVGNTRLTGDYNRELPEWGHAAFRVNIMGQDGGVAGRDVTNNSRAGIAPTLALGMGTPTRLTLDYLHQSEYDIPDYGVPMIYQARAGSGAAIAHPFPLSAGSNNFYGFKNGDYLRTNVDVPTIKLNHDFDNGITLQNQTRYGHYVRQFRITEGQIYTPGTSTLALINPNTPLSALNVTRNELYGVSTETDFTNSTDATLHLQTGPVNHTIVTGLELGRETSAPTRNTTIAPFSTTPLLSPNYNTAYNANTYFASSTYVQAVTEGVYAMDTLKFNDQWEALVGGRLDEFNANLSQQNYNNPLTNTGASTISLKHDDFMPSYRVGLVYKPVLNGTIFVDAGNSYNPSAESLGLSATTANLDPEQTTTQEIGTKWDFFDARLSTQASVYHSEKTNVREADPNNSAVNILAGDAKAEGTELQAIGHITDRWQAIAGYAYTFAVIDKSPTQGITSDLGHRLANVPMHTFNLWTGYTFPFKLEVGAGTNYVSSRFAATTPTNVGGVQFWKESPGYWVFNSMLKYPLTDSVSSQLNIYNITNEQYYDQIHPSHVVPGAGRSAMLTLAVNY